MGGIRGCGGDHGLGSRLDVIGLLVSGYFTLCLDIMQNQLNIKPTPKRRGGQPVHRV